MSELWPFTLQISPELAESFESPIELAQWLESEESTLNSLLASPTGDKGVASTKLRATWATLRQLAGLLRDRPGDATKQTLQMIEGEVRKVFGRRLPLPHRNSPLRKLLVALKEQDPEVCHAALSLLLRANGELTTAAHLAGVELVLFQRGLSPGLTAEREALDSVYHDGRQQVGRLKVGATNYEKKIEALAEKADELLAVAQTRHADLSRVSKEAFDAQLEAAERRLQEHETTYKEKLALHSSVTYWKDRAEGHRRRTRQLGWAFGLALSVACFVMWYFSTLLFTAEVTPQKIAAIFVTASPVFWGLRILSKSLLSNMHLQTDAMERQTLITTYLALHHEGKMRDEDRSVLLATIFRPSATGIVQEDGTPGFIDLVNKVVQK